MKGETYCDRGVSGVLQEGAELGYAFVHVLQEHVGFGKSSLGALALVFLTEVGDLVGVWTIGLECCTTRGGIPWGEHRRRRGAV